MTVTNVLWIVSDTVRDDFLGYNGGHVHTPNLDRLAEKSVVFSRHYAASFPTVPARFDFLTGRPAFIDIGWGPLPRTEPTVAETITSNGLTTLGVSDTPFLQARGFHYDRGFRYYYDMKSQPLGTREFYRGATEFDPETMEEQPITGKLVPEPRLLEAHHAAPLTMTQAENCLEYLYRKPFFMYVDTWDPHEPWDEPDHYVARYFPGYRGERMVPPYASWASQGLTERDVALARALYSGKLEMVDRWIGRLLDKLWYLGIEDQTAVIFTSDHGFYLGEHGYIGKLVRGGAPGEQRWLRSPLYQETIHLPLLISVPGVTPARSHALSWALDLAPTVLDLLGCVPPSSLPGKSLLPVLQGRDFEGHSTVVSAMPLTNLGEPTDVVDSVTRTVDEWQPATVTDARWSLLYSVPGQAVELYDLDHDPAQQSNVAPANPDVVRRLISAYVARLGELGTPERYIRPRMPRP